MASPWTVEITPTAGAGLEQLLEEYGEDAYRDALSGLYRAVYRVSSGRWKVIVLRVGPRGRGIYRGYEKW